MPYHWHAFATPDVDTTCHLEVYMHTLASMMLLKCLIKSSVNMIEKPPTPTLILLCPGNSCSGRRIRQVICRACPQGPGAVDPADLIEATKLHAALRELDSARLNMCVPDGVVPMALPPFLALLGVYDSTICSQP